LRHVILTTAFLLASAAVSAHEPSTPAAEKSTWNQSLPGWWEGPVRYALTDQETREYRSLGTRAERAAFIARFWAARDPDPFTRGNETEEIFWSRVSAANELFTQTTISGWRTDQGRVYIVLGPPDEITNYPLPSVDELDPAHFPDPYAARPQGELRPGHRGAVEWVYRSLKNPRADAGQRVTFIRDESGEFRLSGQLASSFRFEASLTGPATPGDPAAWRDRAGPGEAGGAGGSGILAGQSSRFEGAMRSVEELFAFGQAEMFERAEPYSGQAGRVTTAQIFGVILLQNRFDFFQSDGGTRALITLGVPSDDVKRGEQAAEAVEVFGRLEKEGDSSHVYQFSTIRGASEEAPHQDVGGKRHHLVEIRGTVPPGEYRVNLGIRIGSRIGAMGDRIVVPDFGGEEMLLAGPVLTEQIGERSAAPGSRGIVLGQLRMLPKLDPAFPSGSELGFYFQVYHAVPDAPGGRPRLDIHYSVAVRTNGRFVLQGKPVILANNRSPAHAFVFPLQGWAPGEYLLTVTVLDRVSGQVQTGSAPFLVR
jgi:GWxTD domain-containing protein